MKRHSKCELYRNGANLCEQQLNAVFKVTSIEKGNILVQEH